jgi:RDD family
LRFDEVELEAVPEIDDAPLVVTTERGAPWYKRLLALLTDLSLFAALVLALLPLLEPNHWPSLAALSGFVIVVSFHYFVGTWLLWGKTIGGAIFDVRVVSTGSEAMAFKAAMQRWLGLYLSLLTGGIGFLFSLPDRMSSTRSVAAV